MNFLGCKNGMFFRSGDFGFRKRRLFFRSSDLIFRKSDLRFRSSRLFFRKMGLRFRKCDFGFRKSDKYKVFDRYKAELKEETASPTEFIWYDDLDSDGHSEQIVVYTGGNVNPTRPLVRKSEGQVLDHWPFKDSIASPFLVFGDFDNRNSKEVYLFTRGSDSLFINWFEPFNKGERQQTRFVTRFAVDKKNKTDLSVLPVGLWDSDNDGFKELFFVINTGYSRVPRNLFVFDQKKTLFMFHRKAVLL